MTTDSDLARAAAEAGARLRESAQTHKRSANAHRRAARNNMEALRKLEQECKRHGIILEIESTETQGGQSHGRGS